MSKRTNENAEKGGGKKARVQESSFSAASGASLGVGPPAQVKEDEPSSTDSGATLLFAAPAGPQGVTVVASAARATSSVPPSFLQRLARAGSG